MVPTAHFRVHYPREYEAWARRAATRLESIRERVSREAGFTPSQTIDVLIVNPIADANGEAWPLLSSPRMIFFAEPPMPDEQLGRFGHWIDLLAVHETTHLVHMLRPSRNPLERLLPVDPITLHAPRWVLEGYATVIEGRLTGAGRPNSTIRALILRRWAESGRLPSYERLNSDQHFLGMSMAYLMGSAYLEWLDEKRGPQALRDLWARLTARQRRSFESAFAGVFGDSPERLYGRFTAELTASAIAIERASSFQEGELFQETTRASGAPAVSPDGTRLAIVLRSRTAPPRLVIWSTGQANEEEAKFKERLDKMLARDPEDVAPIREKPLPRKPLHELTMRDGGDIETPRWTRDSKSIVFAHRMPDANGDLHFDLFRWDFSTVERITKLADVRDADPAPDGRSAIGVRNRFGASQLVDVDLVTGDVQPRTEASIDIVETHPRFSPDGKRVARVQHREGRWALLVDDRAIPVDGDAATPEWMNDDDVVFTTFANGFAELNTVRRGAITRTRGGAFEAAPSSDGRVFFMSLDPDGYVLRELPSAEGAPAPPQLEAAFVPAIPPQPNPAAIEEFEEGSVGEPTSALHPELSWFAGGHAAQGDRAFEAGLRIGDLTGRLDALILGSTDDGAAVAATWRGWPVAIGAHVFEDGAEMRASWRGRFPRSTLWLEAGGLSHQFAFATAAFSTRQLFGTKRFEESLRTDVDGSHYRAIVTLGYRDGTLRLGARYQHDEGETTTLGGIASSVRPRSFYARQVLDPALPVAILSGERYDGWRLETSVPSMPFTAFYQHHALDDRELALAGIRFEMTGDPNPILKLPGFDLTAGVARVVDGPSRGDTNWWAGLRWHP
jgi:hypothetical protein